MGTEIESSADREERARVRAHQLVAAGWDIVRGHVPHVGWLWHERGDELVTLLRQGTFAAEEQAFAWLYLRPGDDVLDCGAHVGLYPVLAARATGGAVRVIAVEPNPPTAELLALNLEAHGVRGAVVRRAIWRSPGTMRFEPEAPGRSAFARIAFRTGPGQLELPATTIDAVLSEHAVPPPALIKLGVEGAELEAVEGAADTLAGNPRPVWMVDLGRRNPERRDVGRAELAALLTRSGLVVCGLDEERLQLAPASSREPLEREILFATRDPDAVNKRLRGADGRNLEVASDVLARARACRAHGDELRRLRSLARLHERWVGEARALLAGTEGSAEPASPAVATPARQPAGAGRPAPKVDVCICTHDPRPAVLALAIGSLARQTAGPDAFRVLVVDNASNPPLREEILAPLRALGIEAVLAREDRPGVLHARVHAARKVRAPWALFVDDDNELSDDYVAEGLAFAASRSYVGCFGGKLLLPATARAPRWAEPFLTYLGIKDEGEEVLVGTTQRWGPWEPPGAGSWVRREQLEAFVARVERDERTRSLGRKRRDGLASREDSLIAHAAHDLGLFAAYNPRLWLLHHLDPARFQARYLFRLLHGYGTSHVLFEMVTRPPGAAPPPTPRKYRGFRFVRKLLREFNLGRKQSLAFGIGMVMYHRGIRDAYRRLERGED